MDPSSFGGGGNWNMLTNQDAMFPQSHDLLNLQEHQQQLFEQFQPPQVQPPRQRQLQQFQQQQAPQQFQQQQTPQQFQQQQTPQQFQQQLLVQQQPPPPPPPPQQQSLASHFRLLHLIEKLADAIENGTRDQHFDALVSELTNQFEKCQQLLNTIAGSLSSKSVTVESRKSKLKETEQLLNQQRELMSSYRKSLEGLIRPEPELLQRLSTLWERARALPLFGASLRRVCTLLMNRSMLLLWLLNLQNPPSPNHDRVVNLYYIGCLFIQDQFLYLFNILGVVPAGQQFYRPPAMSC